MLDLGDWRTLLGIGILVLDVTAILRVVTRRQGVDRTLAWLFAILAFPLLGALIYFLLEGPSIRKETRRRRDAAELVHHEGSSVPRVDYSAPAADSVPILELTNAVTGMSATRGNAVELLAEDNQAFASIERALHQAERSVWAEYYIVQNDVTGSRFLDLLAELAARGIEVRFLYDAIGSLRIDEHRLEAIHAAGGHTECFQPLNPLHRRWSVQLRNHRKIVIVDGAIGFTGGMNIGDEYSGRSRRKGEQYFRDTHLALRGPAVRDLATIFAEDWSFATGDPALPLPEPEPVAEPGSVVAVVPSGPDQEFNANGMVYFAGIAAARERVWLSSPYFVPDDATLRALVSTGMRGLDVRLLVPARCDVALVRIAARSYYRQLLSAGVRVFEYQPSMLHAKTIVVDGAWGIVGSANVDVRSLRLNFELGALVYDRAFAARLEERFESDLAASREVLEEELARSSRWTALKEGTVRLLSPLL